MDEQKSKHLSSLQWLKAAEAVIHIEKQRYQYTSSDQEIGEKTPEPIKQSVALSDLNSLKVKGPQPSLTHSKGVATNQPLSPPLGKATVYTLPSQKREE